MNNQEYCPQCPNHCHKSELRCGRGKAFFGEESTRHEGEPRQKLTGIAALLKQCGHIMHHNPTVDNDKLCASLTKEEQQALEKLLNKILNNLK